MLFASLIGLLWQRAKGENEPAASKHTIFPTQDAANEHLAGIEPAADVAYRLSVDRR